MNLSVRTISLSFSNLSRKLELIQTFVIPKSETATIAIVRKSVITLYLITPSANLYEKWFLVVSLLDFAFCFLLGKPNIRIAAGIRVSENNIAAITPKAVKTPKYFIGNTSEVRSEINPTEVVTEVITTGFHIPLSISATASLRVAFGFLRRKRSR